MKKVLLSLVVPFALYVSAAEVSSAELKSFTAQKYRVDYDKQTAENKEKLKKEYTNTLKLSNAIKSEVANDVDYKVATDLISLNIWSQKFIQNYKVSDDKLKELYSKEKPKTVNKYKLSNILVSSEAKAKEIAQKISKKSSKIDEFKKQVSLNSQDFITNKKGGSIGWMEIQNLDKNIQAQIKDKKANDILIAEVKNVGWQVLFVEDFKPARDATFEEAKETLTRLAKQQALIKKIDSLVK